MFKRVLVAGVVLAALMAAAYGSAAYLGVGGGVVQAGLDDDLTCDPDGVLVMGWGYERDTNTVHFVRIGHISPACVGYDLWAGVFDEDGDILDAASGAHNPIDAAEVMGGTQGWVRVHFNAPVDATELAMLQVAIEGGQQ